MDRLVNNKIVIRLRRMLHPFFDLPWVFDLDQAVLDGGVRRNIVRFLSGVQYGSMVDIGCGTGRHSIIAKDRYLGVDMSPLYISACRRRHGGDPKKRFICGDVTEMQLDGEFDLALLVGVLHHLSDAQTLRMLARLHGKVRHVLVVDLYPIPANPISRLLYALDRGEFVRSADAQKELLTSDRAFEVVKEGDFYSTNRLYRHTLLLMAPAAQLIQSGD